MFGATTSSAQTVYLPHRGINTYNFQTMVYLKYVNHGRVRRAAIFIVGCTWFCQHTCISWRCFDRLVISTCTLLPSRWAQWVGQPTRARRQAKPGLSGKAFLYQTRLATTGYREELEFQRTHTLCALSMHFQQSCTCSNNCTAVAGVLHCTHL